MANVQKNYFGCLTKQQIQTVQAQIKNVSLSEKQAKIIPCLVQRKKNHAQLN